MADVPLRADEITGYVEMALRWDGEPSLAVFIRGEIETIASDGKSMDEAADVFFTFIEKVAGYPDYFLKIANFEPRFISPAQKFKSIC